MEKYSLVRLALLVRVDGFSFVGVRNVGASYIIVSTSCPLLASSELCLNPFGGGMGAPNPGVGGEEVEAEEEDVDDE